MKKIYIKLSMLLFLTISFGQEKFTAKADKLFDSYQYVGAIEEYLKIAESSNTNEYVFKQLGDSYYAIFNTAEASKWYAKAVETKKSAPETYYRYAQTLKGIGNYKEANKQMDVFSNLLPNDARSKEHKSNPNYIPSLVDKTKMFDIATTNINSKGQSDFGAVLSNDKTLYFVSTRNTSKKTDKWNNQPYLDIFKSTRSDDGVLSEPTPVSELNTPFHDGPVTISNDGNTMFFARDGLSEGQYAKSKSGNYKVGQQGLYKATKIDDKWTQVEPLSINSTSYSVTNPSLSKDGKTLYFASNMPGGIGESDIWKISIESNGYGQPQNLGNKINSTERENFPFITEDNVLYFASSGKPGLGGFDVFKIDLNTTEQAENLGKPLNSEKDDFSFSFNKTANVGYFSSNREGSDAIYSVKPICNAQAVVVVTNKKTGAVLANASVAISDAKGNVIATKKSDSDGKVSYDVACQTAYNLVAVAQNFETTTVMVAPIKVGEITTSVSLEPVSVIITDTEVILNPIYFDFNKSNITSQGAGELDKLVKVMKDYPKMIIFVKSHTDSKGSPEYNMVLSEQRAQATVQYLMSKGISGARITGKGFGSSELKIKCGAKCTDEEHSQNRRSEFLIVKK
jgi:outer membrane protein OmpA-like peptidoglycan-associated protein/tetratricopeptide (TPR) repeat protein